MCNTASSGRTVSSPACFPTIADECLGRYLPSRMTESANPESCEPARIVVEIVDIFSTIVVHGMKIANNVEVAAG
jgi:hypothetical protein